MAFKYKRESLSRQNRLRRSYYELIRDECDQYMVQYALVDSYHNFISSGEPYPFVEKRELKPRARIPDIEYSNHNTFLFILCEDTIPSNHKKNIRFFNVNKTTKTNLMQSRSLSLADEYDRTQKYFESDYFFDFVKKLLPIDYALLIQRDRASRKVNRYHLSHYHVRIDWPIADAAEDLAIGLRYISKDLYEKGDKYAEDLQKKFFEYFGVPYTVGGRRTAAVVAAQYFRRLTSIVTVYVASSESRSLLRTSERGVSKTVLIKFKPSEMQTLAEANQLTLRAFRKNYVVAKEGPNGICLFQTDYAYTMHAIPPDDGKLRELKPDLNWLSVDDQYILPNQDAPKQPPLSTNLIYT